MSFDARVSDVVSGDRLRRAMGHFATGVAVVSSIDAAGQPVGTTANAISSLSLDPPLVLVCLRRESRTLRVVLTRRRFALSVLEAGQEAIARQFAHSTKGRAWGVVPHNDGLLTGAPLIDSAPATLEAEVHDTADGGDHLIVIGRVLELWHTDDHVPPLVFHRGAYTRLAPMSHDEPVSRTRPSTNGRGNDQP